MALIGKVGGAAGPLYGTAFLRASTALSEKEEVSAEDAAEALEAALGGVKQRGKAEVGDKTMVDALDAGRRGREGGADADGSVAGVFRAAARGREGGGRVDGPAHGEEGAGELPRRQGRGAPGPRRDLDLPAPGRGGPVAGRFRLMVGLVLVSHSPKIAEGTADLVRQMAGEVEISRRRGRLRGRVRH